VIRPLLLLALILAAGLLLGAAGTPSRAPASADAARVPAHAAMTGPGPPMSGSQAEPRHAPVPPGQGGNFRPHPHRSPVAPQSTARLARRQTARRQLARTGMITLSAGDTLWQLAARYHTTVAALQGLNRLGGSTMIYAGRHLLVPAAPPGPAGTLSRQADRSRAAGGPRLAGQAPAGGRAPAAGMPGPAPGGRL